MAKQRRISGKNYVQALVVLLLLTAVSWGVAHVPLGPLGPAVALGIAGGKALIVLFVFMHLLEQGFVMRLVVMVAIIFIIILCLGIVADVAYRGVT